jgi:MFS transporter, UMF1 family
MSATDSQNPDSGTQDRQTAAGAAASHPVRRRAVAAWALWDWGASAYSTIVTSFVFAPYLTGVVAKDRPPDSLSGETWLGIALFIAGFFVAALAPVTGQRADAGGHRKRRLACSSSATTTGICGSGWPC